MRYLGNKTSILDKIEELLENKGLLNQRLTFFDAFCGSGSVSDHFKKHYDIIVNDNLTWSVIYTKGRIVAPICDFAKLGFDPFEYMNKTQTTVKGFMYKTYSPSESSRMYFTTENAERIDYFRWQIEEWKNNHLINDNEYAYLLASLIESVSDVSNTAGVYGAFLKKWDSRALKPIIFSKVDYSKDIPTRLTEYTDKIENIISDIDCDILYLDPPYTQNQYGTQYHLLETLVLNDEPSVSEITGSRPTSPMRSDWSKDIKAHILFDRIVAKTRAKYIVFSYNNDGFMSKEYIEATLKRYGKVETYVCKKIPYKKYQNWKSCNENTHFEYLFFVEKKPIEEVVIESPLNYIGSKAKVVRGIKEYCNKNCTEFFDLFGGGFNVGINMPMESIVYNDINYFVSELVKSFEQYDTYEYISFVRKTILAFNLQKGNEESYYAIRDHYNSLPHSKRDPRILFTMLLYGYQQQIRFNGKHDFNNPVGIRWFNDKVLEKMISFSRVIKEKKCLFFSDSYIEFEQKINVNSFVYMDPPYQLTTGSYNDGKRGFNGWNEELEAELFSFADRLNHQGVSFMLSYVKEHKGETNDKLISWVDKNNYSIIELGEIIGISGSRRKEVLVINYDL